MGMYMIYPHKLEKGVAKDRMVRLITPTERRFPAFLIADTLTAGSVKTETEGAQTWNVSTYRRYKISSPHDTLPWHQVHLNGMEFEVMVIGFDREACRLEAVYCIDDGYHEFYKWGLSEEDSVELERLISTQYANTKWVVKT